MYLPINPGSSWTSSVVFKFNREWKIDLEDLKYETRTLKESVALGKIKGGLLSDGGHHIDVKNLAVTDISGISLSRLHACDLIHRAQFAIRYESQSQTAAGSHGGESKSSDRH